MPVWAILRAAAPPARWSVKPFAGGPLDGATRQRLAALYRSEADALAAMGGDHLFGFVRPWPSGSGVPAGWVVVDGGARYGIEPAAEGDAAALAQRGDAVALFAARDDAEAWIRETAQSAADRA